MAKSSRETSRQETQQPRPFWSGVVAFGLVSLPVSLFPANRGKPFSLSMVDENGVQLRRRYFCEKEGKLLNKDDIVRGYSVEKDRFVIVEDEELEALAPEKSREIDLRRFVPLEDVNPIYFERGYFLAPDSDTTKAYRLLAKSMEEEQRAGIATFVMRDREYIIAIIAEGGILRAETLRFHDEIRSPEQVGLPPLSKPEEQPLQQMVQAMEALAGDTLDRELLTEDEVLRARELVEHKLAAGTDVLEEPEPPQYEDEDNVVDLMQVLKERLQGKRSEPTQQPQDFSDEVDTLSRQQLYERAQELHIAGRSKMTKEELAQALKHAG